MPLIAGRATPEGTAEFARRAASSATPVAAGCYRSGLGGLTLCSIGLGTYLGNADDETDSLVQAAAAAATAAGVNVIDTAINYRHQRAERCLGRLLPQLLAPGRLSRDSLFVSTKAGYVPFDGSAPANRSDYIRETYIRTGVLGPTELVGGNQCIAPRFLRDQIDRSRVNLGLETLDLFYLHNPEYLLATLGKKEWLRRMEAAFRCLEEAAGLGLIAAYGTATWDGYRVGPDRPDHLSLAELVELARQLKGDRHHFRAVQLPISLAATEAAQVPTQSLGGKRVTLLSAAAQLGVTVFASAPLLQGRVIASPPATVPTTTAGLSTDAQRAIQWVRSQVGVTTTLVGMKSPERVRENLQLLSVPPSLPSQSPRP